MALLGCGAAAPLAVKSEMHLVDRGGPVELTVEPSAAVRHAGGEQLAEFRRGRVVAAQSGCLACHRIGDMGNRGPGANLTRIGSKLSRSRIEHVLVAGPEPMPSFSRLPAAKRRPLVTFLALLR